MILVLNSDGRQRVRLTAPHASRETPADCYDLLLLFNHEPWTTASRKARLTRPASPQGLKATPSPASLPFPSPRPRRGCAVAHATKAPFGRHENVQASRRGREKARPFSRPFRSNQGKVGLSQDSSGAILLRTALPIAIRPFTLKGSHSILANILVARRLPKLARQQYKPKPHEAKRATAQ